MGLGLPCHQCSGVISSKLMTFLIFFVIAVFSWKSHILSFTTPHRKSSFNNISSFNFFLKLLGGGKNSLCQHKTQSFSHATGISSIQKQISFKRAIAPVDPTQMTQLPATPWSAICRVFYPEVRLPRGLILCSPSPMQL